MTWNRWALRCGLGLAFGIGIGASPGCRYSEADEFIADFSDELCRVERECDAGIKVQRLEDDDWAEVELPSDASCEGTVEAAYTRCDEDCDSFNKRLARKCMRRIKRRGCSNPADESVVIPESCDRVFTRCEGGSCSATQCSFDPNRPEHGGWLGLALLTLVGIARRRRT